MKTQLEKGIAKLVKNLNKIPDEFWTRAEPSEYLAIWFMSRQRPSVEQDYSFDEERFGITKEGSIIWGFSSGCSCPSPWSNDSGEYTTSSYKEFDLGKDYGFDPDWKEESYKNLVDYLMLIDAADGTLEPADVLKAANAEVRRYLIKRVGYKNIKNSVNAVVIHKDGTSELLRFADGDMYVKVKDSSTDREYLLYVASHVTTCKEAIAWTFGLKKDEYNPIIET